MPVLVQLNLSWNCLAHFPFSFLGVVHQPLTCSSHHPSSGNLFFFASPKGQMHLHILHMEGNQISNSNITQALTLRQGQEKLKLVHQPQFLAHHQNDMLAICKDGSFKILNGIPLHANYEGDYFHHLHKQEMQYLLGLVKLQVLHLLLWRCPWWLLLTDLLFQHHKHTVLKRIRRDVWPLWKFTSTINHHWDVLPPQTYHILCSTLFPDQSSSTCFQPFSLVAVIITISQLLLKLTGGTTREGRSIVEAAEH